VEDGSSRLTEDGALATARESSQLDDFGSDDSFRIGLRIFIEALEAMDPPPELREAARPHINKLLTDRLHWVADETASPEILEIPVERPVIVIGMPRTGTTVLYDYLACDPVARAPLYWEAGDVWPAPEIATYDTDPRIATAQASIDALLAGAPEIAQMLPLGATLPAECNRIMPYHFYGPELGTFYGVPQHSAWVANEKPPGLYQTHKRVLQQMAWKGPRGRWTLKSPVHLYNLDALVDAYPDACLVWTHRDLANVFTSLVDLIAAARRVMGHDTDRRALGAELLELFGAALDRGMAARSDPRIAERILDLPFRDTVNNPISVVRQVHDRFDLPFTADHEAAIHRFIADHPKGEHRYRPSDCGYEPDTFTSRFPEYYERYGYLLASP